MDFWIKELELLVAIAGIWGVYFIQKHVFLEERTKKHTKILFICSVAFLLFSLVMNEVVVVAAYLFVVIQGVFFRKKRRLLGILSGFMAMSFLDVISGFITAVFLYVIRPMVDVVTASKMISVLIGIICIIGDYIITKKRERDKEEFPGELSTLSKCYLYVMCVFMYLDHFLILADVPLTMDTLPTMYEAMSLITITEIFQMFFGSLVSIIVIVLLQQSAKKEQFYRQVQKMQHNIILTMADIVENRDENTGEHIRRTADYVEIIARSMQKQNAYPDILTDAYIADMIVAAPLHDMGKIHVPDKVLNKPGRLDEEEFLLMKQHALEGEKLLSKAEDNLGDMSYLKIAISMAGYHHEWWNGEGYPHKVSGEEIPLCARIMAVADVFDALLSKRCYKDAMSLEKAYEIMEKETGTHFDPVVMKAFWAAREELEKAANQD